MTTDPEPRRNEYADRGFSDPERIFKTLTKHKVDFVVIGGYATIAHGNTRNTRDVDFVAAADLPNLERLAVALRELNTELWGVDAHVLGIDISDPKVLANGSNFTLVTDAGGLDFFNEVPGGRDYTQLRADSVEVDLGDGLVIRVAGRDDLIRMKQAAGRPRDIADIAALTDPGLES